MGPKPAAFLVAATALALPAYGCAGSHGTAAATSAGGGIPRAWKRACERSHECDPATVTGSVPAALFRRLHFPRVGARGCPASSGRARPNPIYGPSVELGTRGPVWVVIANAGDLRRGRVRMGMRDASGWHGLKAHFLSTPGYQGPILVRAARLDRPAAVELGQPRTRVPWTIVPAGPTASDSAGWRDLVSATWVKGAGCYGWQIDGLTFSETVIVRVPPG